MRLFRQFMEHLADDVLPVKGKMARCRGAVVALAAVVTNPTDESNSSRLAVIWKQFGG